MCSSQKEELTIRPWELTMRLLRSLNCSKERPRNLCAAVRIQSLDFIWANSMLQQVRIARAKLGMVKFTSFSFTVLSFAFSRHLNALPSFLLGWRRNMLAEATFARTLKTFRNASLRSLLFMMFTAVFANFFNFSNCFCYVNRTPSSIKRKH